MKTLMYFLLKGRAYVKVDQHLLVTMHALEQAKARGVSPSRFLEKILREKEEIKDYVADQLGTGKVRGFFYLTFPSKSHNPPKRGKIVWEVMDSQTGRRFESVEEVSECNSTVIVIYTYLSQSQPFFHKTRRSRERRGLRPYRPVA